MHVHVVYIHVYVLISLFVQQNNARVIADSILALHRGELISNPLDDPHVTSELREQGASLSQGGGADGGEVVTSPEEQN